MPHIQTEQRENEWWGDTTAERENFVQHTPAGRVMAELGQSIHQDQKAEEVAQYVHVRVSR